MYVDYADIFKFKKLGDRLLCEQTKREKTGCSPMLL